MGFENKEHDVHTELSTEKMLEEERARLLRETGITQTPRSHFKRPHERRFTREEREQVTVLFGGLTVAHDRLFKAGLCGLGYHAENVPMPCKNDFQAGKEFGNNGQCNPTYFTVGALINYLIKLRDEQGIPTEQILDNYIFVTAGSCGPCRFGMYEAEYRLALQNAGFDGFRVILFDQTGGGQQDTAGNGFEVNPRLFLTLLNAILLGDLINAVFFHSRPYAISPESVGSVYEKCMDVCERVLRTKNHPVKRSWFSMFLRHFTAVENPADVDLLIAQYRNTDFFDAMTQCRAIIEAELEVDYTRPKPIVKITGEFWAQTTEGDGNFRMFNFLEGEGAEVLVEPITTWIDYTLHDLHLYIKDRKDVAGLGNGQTGPIVNLITRLRAKMDYIKQDIALTIGEKLLKREYQRLRKALGGSVHPLADQLELQRVGHPYYNPRATGGEGYLEVAKNIYYYNRELAHMTLSLKPFGCMPSTQSDGAQAAVIANYPEINYLPIETSGEGDINAYSRVQMALGEAKAHCKDEFKRAVERSGYAIEDLRAYVTAHRELRNPLYNIPHIPGVLGRAANFILHIAQLMDNDPDWSRKREAQTGEINAAHQA